MSLQHALKDLNKGKKKRKDTRLDGSDRTTNSKASRVKKFINDNFEAFEELNDKLTEYYSVRIKDEVIFSKTAELESQVDKFKFKFIDLKLDNKYLKLRNIKLDTPNINRNDRIRKLIGLVELSIINTGKSGLNLPIKTEHYRLYRNYLKMISNYKRELPNESKV